MRMNRIIVSLLTLPFLMWSCSVIDEDLSDCGRDNRIDYRLRLITNIQAELDDQLHSAEEQHVAEALKAALSGIFTETAHDVSLSFYGTDSVRAKHETHIMDASQTSYTIYLPVREYMHLALANVADAANVSVSDDNKAQHSRLLQADGDTVASHTTGLFSARLPMRVTEEESQTFKVDLYMANSAAALVIDTAGVAGIQDIRIYSSGFANSFVVRDSLYTYNRNPIVRSVPVGMSGGHHVCHYTVNFPSFQRPVSRATAEYWRFIAYVTVADGSVTENIISIEKPLLPAHLKVVKMRMKDDGSLVPQTNDVGVSVTLNWKQGGVYEPEL
ncbi:MAG: hypothetical protein J6B33_04365 [Prevotella sp.]|nr:hypothetical protein [Prevotella sp.]